jgi:raffinose/stachyose/melibiose transport system permease protein
MFTLLLNPSFGVIKYFFTRLGLDLSQVPNLFGNSKYAFWTVTVTWIFYSAFNTIIFLAEMEAVDKAVYEAAAIDGASPWQIDRFIVLPMMKNIIGTCVVLASVAMVSQFDIIYMTTRGGPGTATINLPVYLYKAASLENNYGKANAVGVIQIMIGLGLIMLIQAAFSMKRQKDIKEGLL